MVSETGFSKLIGSACTAISTVILLIFRALHSIAENHFKKSLKIMKFVVDVFSILTYKLDPHNDVNENENEVV